MMTSKTYQHINLDYLNLMADNDEDMKKIMLDMLLKELPVELEKMRSLEQAANWDELGNVSHKMKSTLAYVGNDEMTMANKTIEKLAKTASDVHELSALVKTLEENALKVIPELQSAAS